jgi:hypothetical protein
LTFPSTCLWPEDVCADVIVILSESFAIGIGAPVLIIDATGNGGMLAFGLTAIAASVRVGPTISGVVTVHYVLPFIDCVGRIASNEDWY